MSASSIPQIARSPLRARWRGFCPACAVIRGSSIPPGDEAPAAGVATMIVLGAAMAAWAWTAWQMRGAGMAMGPGSLASFAVLWAAMMAAMMLPSAILLVHGFAQQARGRRRRAAALATLLAVYLAVWLVFGVICYVAYNALGLPWSGQAQTGGVALGVAALYALTPIQRAGQERCRQLTALRAPLPFGVVRAGAVAGWRYGLSCLGCSAGLMVAMVLVGMTSLGWTVVLAALVLAYKFSPRAALPLDAGLAVVIAVLAVVYVLA